MPRLSRCTNPHQRTFAMKGVLMAEDFSRIHRVGVLSSTTGTGAPRSHEGLTH